jgi:hypothetical protein
MFTAKKLSENEWRTIKNEVELLPYELRGAVLDLCVLNEPINSRLYAEMCRFLDRIADISEPDWARHHAPKVTFPKPRIDTQEAAKPSEDDVEDAVLENVLMALRPDPRLKRLKKRYFAIRDREDFRQEKFAHRKALFCESHRDSIASAEGVGSAAQVRQSAFAQGSELWLSPFARSRTTYERAVISAAPVLESPATASPSTFVAVCSRLIATFYWSSIGRASNTVCVHHRNQALPPYQA